MPDLVLVSGQDREGVAAVAAALRDRAGPRAAPPDGGAADRGDLVVITYDLSGLDEGVVHRALDDATGRHRSVLELAHGCVSCTLREDLLPLLISLARDGVHRVVLALDPGMEPDSVAEALHHVLPDGADHPVTDVLPVAGVVTVLDGARWLDDAVSDEALVERGRGLTPDDERTVARLAVGAVEFADVLVVAGAPVDAWERARRDAVLDRLAPQARRLHVVGLAGLDGAELRALLDDLHPESRRGAVDDPHGPLLRAQPPLGRDAGVSLLHVGLRRPFHPERLHAAIEVLLDGTVRVRGRVWVASRPDSVLWLQSAGGGLEIGEVGPWLAADDELWDAVDAERRAAAAIRWDERFGDREQQLTVLVLDADPSAVVAALDDALLTDAELADGRSGWLRYPDPFGLRHVDPCDDLPRDVDPAIDVTDTTWRDRP